MKSKPYDPMWHDVELPLAGTYYPLGFRVTLRTNSQEVQAAAAESWGWYGLEFDRPPVEVRIIVREQGDLAPEPAFLTQGHLLTIVSDRDNFASADLRALFSYAFVSARTAADHAWLRWFFLEPMVYFLLAQSYTTPVHAACVAKEGRGILLSGLSGAGKSTLAFACARAGWTFVADDATALRIAIGKPHQARVRDDAPRLFPELEGFCTSARPNGKLSIEIPLDAFAHIQTALHCRIETIVFLDRRPGTPGLQNVPAEEVAAAFLADMPSYGDEVRARNERVVGRLSQLPAYRLRYERLADALQLLEGL
ncbi:Hpr(Ser) kinase/phosphatase [Candidatus Sulfopaludibacter sp. SbA3]|nr:Hpr(Ser) kinase/phosphatase [Candidatus Sulfopaludibacter sp. SbA3]